MTHTSQNLVYLNYWKRKQLARQPPAFAVRRHRWDIDDLSEAHSLIYDAIARGRSVLDVGAGSMRFMQLVQRRGFNGTYHTQDIGNEFEYTYTDLDQVFQTYDVVVCMDVLEHLTLSDGVAFLHRLLSLVSPGGVLAIQTPNANFHRHPLSWDMTHVHAYNPVDLWSYLTALGTQTTVYRLELGPPPTSLRDRLHARIRAWIASEMQLDHCENLLALVTKPLHSG